MSEKEIKTEGGAAVEGDANTGGGSFTGRDDQKQYNQRTEQRQYDQRQDNRLHDQRSDQRSYEQRDDARGGNVTFQNADNMHLWAKLLEIGATVNNLVVQMDNLPHRVDRLERLEVVVRPGPEVILRPAAQDSVSISYRMLIVIFLGVLLGVLALMGWLVYLQIR